MRNGTGKPLTAAQKIANRLSRKRGDVFLRSDFDDIGSYSNVGVALSQLIRSGKLMRLGKGVYSRAVPSPLDGTSIPPKGVQEIATQALTRLGVKTALTRLERDYNAGRTTQVPSGQVIGVERRVRRQLGYNGMLIQFELV